MATKSIQQFAIVRAPAEEVWAAWLDSKDHSRFAGTRASISAREEQPFNIGGDAITGTTHEVHPGELIVQSLRTRDFPSDSADSHVEVRFDELPDLGTRVTLTQDDIPDEAIDTLHDHWDSFFARLSSFFGAPRDAKVALITGEPPRKSPRENLEEKPRRKPARSRPSAAAARSGSRRTAARTATERGPVTREAKRRSPRTRLEVVASTPDAPAGGRTKRAAKAGRPAAALEPRPSKRRATSASEAMPGIGGKATKPRRSARKIAEENEPRTIRAGATARGQAAARVAQAPGKATAKKVGKSRKKSPPKRKR